jgi:putative CGCGG family rSAM target protein
MSNASAGHDQGTEPVTDRVHDSTWAADLERPQHAVDMELLVEEAIKAIENTTAGTFLQLVTHEAHGHPSEYLYEVLDDAFDDDIEWEYICQCNCGGHILRVYT